MATASVAPAPTFLLDLADARAVRALDVLATADRWIRAHRTSDGHPFFVIPSATSSAVYWADQTACTCPDATRRDVTCKHTLAVRLWAAHQRIEARTGRKGVIAAA